jgi:DNA-binding ferritin-like protein
MKIWPFSTIAKLQEDKAILRQNLTALAQVSEANCTRATKAEAALALAKEDYSTAAQQRDNLQERINALGGKATPTAASAKPATKRAKKVVK